MKAILGSNFTKCDTDMFLKLYTVFLSTRFYGERAGGGRGEGGGNMTAICIIDTIKILAFIACKLRRTIYVIITIITICLFLHLHVDCIGMYRRILIAIKRDQTPLKFPML